MAMMVDSERQCLQEAFGCVSKAPAVWTWTWTWGLLRGEVCQVVVRARVCAGTLGDVSTGCCLTPNHWGVCVRACVCAYSCLCLPIRNRLLWLPHCEEGRKGEEGWLAFAQQTRSFLRVRAVYVRGMGVGRTGHRNTKKVKVSVRPPNPPYSVLFVTNQCFTCTASLALCVCVYTHNLTNIGFCVCIGVYVCTIAVMGLGVWRSGRS